MITGARDRTKSNLFFLVSSLSVVAFLVTSILMGRMRMNQPTEKATIVSQNKCLINSLKGTPAMLQAIIIPGIMGLENSKI